MCGSCVTNVEAIVVGATSAAGVALSLAERAVDVVRGRTPDDRAMAAYAANAGFLRSLGHDPARVLGPPPEPRPVRAPVPAATGGALQTA